jgi:hypothetical protein
MPAQLLAPLCLVAMVTMESRVPFTYNRRVELPTALRAGACGCSTFDGGSARLDTGKFELHHTQYQGGATPHQKRWTS